MLHLLRSIPAVLGEQHPGQSVVTGWTTCPTSLPRLGRAVAPHQRETKAWGDGWLRAHPDLRQGDVSQPVCSPSWHLFPAHLHKYMITPMRSFWIILFGCTSPYHAQRWETDTKASAQGSDRFGEWQSSEIGSLGVKTVLSMSSNSGWHTGGWDLWWINW